MDIRRSIEALKRERTLLADAIDNLDRAIAVLETLEPEVHVGRSRGRKGMGPAERQEVSARMKRYWAGRRKAAQS